MFVNLTIGEQDGVQVGVGNAVRELYGAQIGLFNYAVNEVYGSYFTGTPPARATVEVSRLPRDVRVEIDLVAVVP